MYRRRNGFSMHFARPLKFCPSMPLTMKARMKCARAGIASRTDSRPLDAPFCALVLKRSFNLRDST